MNTSTSDNNYYQSTYGSSDVMVKSELDHQRRNTLFETKNDNRLRHWNSMSMLDVNM
eukprot:Pgem_evm1s18206